jgi:hypothetical protein
LQQVATFANPGRRVCLHSTYSDVEVDLRKATIDGNRASRCKVESSLLLPIRNTMQVNLPIEYLLLLSEPLTAAIP